MSCCYLTSGMTFGRVRCLLADHGPGSDPRSLWRAARLLNMSLPASSFAWQERLRTSAALREAPPPSDPLFVVGHWRSGSTLLHRLLALDPGFVSPTLFQCTFPDSFLTSRPWLAPPMAWFTATTRPMDGMEVRVDSPEEDEFALLRLVGSPLLERLLFPVPGAPFPPPLEDLGPAARDEERWAAALRGFYTRVAQGAAGRLLIKNPFHSARVPLLRRLFPDARFLRITRRRDHVLRSTARLWDTLARDNALRPGWGGVDEAALGRLHDELTGALDDSFAELPPDRGAAVDFAQLEAQPLTTLRAAYEQLQLLWSEEYERAVEGELRSLRGYRKNSYD